MDDYQVTKRRRLGYKPSFEERRLGEQATCRRLRQGPPTLEQIEAVQTMTERSYGARIDSLPTDIRRELRKFICPYVLRLKDLDIVLYFPDVKRTIKIEYYEDNKFCLCRMLNTLSRSDLMKENVCYREVVNYGDYWTFDRHILRIQECDTDIEFSLPIRPVLIDALTRACNDIILDYDLEEEEYSTEFETSKVYGNSDYTNDYD